MNNKSKYIYVLSIFIAGLLWGFIGFFAITLSNNGYSSIEITFIRNFIAMIGLLLIIVFKDKNFLFIDIKDIWMFLATGIGSIVFFNVMYFLTINILSLSLAAILLYTGPFFVVILSSLFFKEKITKYKIIELVIASLGCVLTVGVNNESIDLIPLGIITGLLSGLGYGLYSIFGKIALKKYSTYTVTFYTFLIAASSLSVFCINKDFILSFNTTVMLSSIGIGIVSTLAPFILYGIGLKNIEAGKASIMTFIEPVVATLIGIFVFKEVITFSGVVGMFLIFVALILLNLKK